MTEPTDTLVFSVVQGSGPDAFVDQIVDLVQSAYRGDSSRKGWTTEADILEGQRVDSTMIDELLARDDSVILTARQGAPSGALVGCCELRNQPEDATAYLGMFAVSPDLQAGGVGRRILAEAEALVAARWGASRMVMTVIDVRDELIAWYERRGYERTGETGEFPYGDERFGVPLRQDLAFVTLAKNISVVND